MNVYLDHSATTPPSAAVRNLVEELLQSGWYNPSALYRPAMEIQKKMDRARERCLHAAEAEGNRVIFTSGGTESDNLAIFGTLKKCRHKGKVLISSVEHPAVSACAEEIQRNGFTVESIPVTSEAVIDPDQLKNLLDPDVCLIAVMQVNNETGTIQPLREITRLRDQYCPEAAVHVDGVQGFLRVPVRFNALGIQSYAFSGHKIGALKGTGGLIVRKDHRLSPILWGGGQENNERSGTENTLGILALCEAIATYDPAANERMKELKNRLWFKIKEGIQTAVCNGPYIDNEAAAPHILNIALEPVRSQTMLFALEGDGVYVSAGSACASRKQKISPVLKASGVPTQRADCSVRFSLGPETTAEEIDYAAARVCAQYQTLKKYVRR